MIFHNSELITSHNEDFESLKVIDKCRSSRMSHKEKTILGVVWSILSQIGTTLSQFTLGIILARLLSPREYGLMAMVMIIVGYANLMMNFGFGAALVQKESINEQDLSSSF